LFHMMRRNFYFYKKRYGMGKYLGCLLLFLLCNGAALAQNVRIQILRPEQFSRKTAILLTREKGFASIVHSLKLTHELIELQMSVNLVPDLYQLTVSGVKGSLYLFLENGANIRLDTADISNSVVMNSKSNLEWQVFRARIQQPSDDKLSAFSEAEARARKRNDRDSLAYWTDRRATEQKEVLIKIREYIRSNPKSFVSLYLLRNNWLAFKNEGLFEKLDVSLAGHRSYQLLKDKKRAVVRSESR
jgi:hypothetical protein